MFDRRVQILDQEMTNAGAVQRVSDLRHYPFLVLLGEPGIGKTTVMEGEAAADGVNLTSVRAVVNRITPDPGLPLYLDGLDEYRMQGDPADKAYRLAAAIGSLAPPRWRLACRSEDWRKAADIAAIKATAGGAGVIVAQILPLDEPEIEQLLVTLGEENAPAFIAQARKMGVAALLENPLSLKLLHKAVVGGKGWPASRFALFDSATTSLSFEVNEEHKRNRQRSSADQILLAAAQTCLFLLTTGSRAVWRSNAAPPDDLGPRAVLSVNGLGITHQLVDDMLDTPLFSGEGELFEPMHRSVAEYLGGRALATAVRGTKLIPAFPLNRALALLTGRDAKPPTELRGLYAWFAAHLADQGESAKARELVMADAFSVLAYGDASVFDVETRRALLQALDRDDPYFLGGAAASTVLGGLASDDLAAEFRAILESPDETHRLSMVFEVLTNGNPVEGVRPLLRSIALDPSRPEWQRSRAIEAWLNGAGDVDAARRDLFTAMAAEAESTVRESLRAQLLAKLPRALVSLADIRDVLSAFARSAEDVTTLRLYGLGRRLKKESWPEMFEAPIASWLPDDPARRQSLEVAGVLDDMLAGAIGAAGHLDAAQLWRWTVNARDNRWEELGEASAAAVTTWLDADPGRHATMLDAIIADVDQSHGAWTIGESYWRLANQRPDEGLVRNLMAQVDSTAPAGQRDRLVTIIVELARHKSTEPDSYFAVYEWLAGIERGEAWLARLTTSVVDQIHRGRLASTSKRQAKIGRRHLALIRLLEPRLPELRSGAADKVLHCAAATYFRTGRKEHDRKGVERLVDVSNAVIAEAAITGFRALVHGPFPFTPHDLGAAEEGNLSYFVELPALAGVDLLLEEAPLLLETAPLILALVVLRTSGVIADEAQRDAVEAWAWHLLNRDPQAGAALIEAQWQGLLDANATMGSPIWLISQHRAGGAAVQIALRKFLTERPDLPVDPLRILLVAAARRIDRAGFGAIALAALECGHLAPRARALWSLVVFAVGGDAERGRLEGHAADDIHCILDERLGDGLLEALPVLDDAERASRAAAVVRLLGASSTPEQARPGSGRLVRVRRVSDAVQRALTALEANADPFAGVVLEECLADTNLASWHQSIRHARAQHRRIVRDAGFNPPSVAMVRDALAGNGPINAADLRAIVVEELHRLARELRTGSTAPWRDYWNTDDHGRPVDAKIENIARDITLTKLQERLRHYGILVALPEGQRANDSRADILILTGAGRNLPVEAKRHYHKDLWVAASGQLQGYAAAELADGYGILLVFWFGLDWRTTPTRADKAIPQDAVDLTRMLVDDLPPDIRDRTDVVVFDVSRPGGGKPRSGSGRKRVGSPAASGA